MNINNMRYVLFVLLGLPAMVGLAQEDQMTVRRMSDKAPREIFAADLASIIARDIKKVSAWYVDNLNFKIYKKLQLGDTLEINFLEREDFKLEIVGKPGATDRSSLSSFSNPSLSGFNKISFRVLAIRKLAEKLNNHNVVFKTPVFYDKLFKLTSFIVEDPEGNIIQFVEYD